ncbi:hypothetical protein [Clostridium baratii]|uniref:hypothetical protein n=1 Tax=Clostridium baratii TaxID=1561 RepID=UPI0005F29B24|nr:hypothetical protein [Clostridium baratii]AQM58905.1 hypothetical protein NPD11_740 [Clostridium baratii]KJU72977.1 hypothetical protein UC77_03080 [Clostridium baratii]
MNIFYGSYGFDILSIFLLIVSMFLNLNKYTHLVGTLLILFVIYRAFSKNIYKRSLELNKFTSLVNKILGKFGKRLPENLPRTSLDHIPYLFNSIKYKINQKFKYKIVKCPKCNQKLRLPRGKGNIIVTCKRCSHEFRIKT